MTHSYIREVSWRREWLPTPVFLPEESHEQRSLAGYSPWGHKESDRTDQLTLSLALPSHVSNEKTQLKSNCSRGCVTSRSETQLGLETRSLAPKTRQGWSVKAEGGERRNCGIRVDKLLLYCKASHPPELQRTHHLLNQRPDWWHLKKKNLNCTKHIYISFIFVYLKKYFLWGHAERHMGILVPWPGVKLKLPALEPQSLTCWDHQERPDCWRFTWL